MHTTRLSKGKYLKKLSKSEEKMWSNKGDLPNKNVKSVFHVPVISYLGRVSLD